MFYKTQDLTEFQILKKDVSQGPVVWQKDESCGYREYKYDNQPTLSVKKRVVW